jgi:hypothetical protein
VKQPIRQKYVVEKAVLEVNLWKLVVFLFLDTLRYYPRYKIHLYRTKVIIRRLFVTGTFCYYFCTASFRANQNKEILDQILTFATGASLQLHSYYSSNTTNDATSMHKAK